MEQMVGDMVGITMEEKQVDRRTSKVYIGSARHGGHAIHPERVALWLFFSQEETMRTAKWIKCKNKYRLLVT